MSFCAFVYEPGEIRVGAVIGGKTGYAKITMFPSRPKSVEITPPGPVVVGRSQVLQATARNGRFLESRVAPKHKSLAGLTRTSQNKICEASQLYSNTSKKNAPASKPKLDRSITQ